MIPSFSTSPKPFFSFNESETVLQIEARRVQLNMLIYYLEPWPSYIDRSALLPLGSVLLYDRVCQDSTSHPAIALHARAPLNLATA
jgi:hypothetical protein